MNKKEVGSMKKTGENSLADVLRSGYMIAETCLEQIMKYDGEEVARLFQDRNVLRELLPLRSDINSPPRQILQSLRRLPPDQAEGSRFPAGIPAWMNR